MKARRERVHELSLAGKSKRTIAAELGVAESTVARDLKARLEAVRMKAELNRIHQLAQAKKLPGFQRPEATEGHGTPGGHGMPGASRAVLKMMARRSKPLGPDAPEGMEGSGPEEERTGKPDGDPTKEKPKMDFSALSTEETEEFLRLLYKGTGTNESWAYRPVD